MITFNFETGYQHKVTGIEGGFLLEFYPVKEQESAFVGREFHVRDSMLLQYGDEIVLAILAQKPEHGMEVLEYHTPMVSEKYPNQAHLLGGAIEKRNKYFTELNDIFKKYLPQKIEIFGADLKDIN